MTARRGGEKALLLNPYADEAPEDHLRFDGEGRVFARANSEMGEATITTCGLHRLDLVTLRASVARRVNALIHGFARSITQERADRHLRDLYSLGKREAPFAGMVRMLVDEQLPGMARSLWPDPR